MNNTVKKNCEMEKECLICADKMKGQVIMECGHMCCTTCFAKHSRINNTCPFCRAEFAPPVIKKEKMSLEVAEAMASLTVIESKDLSRELLSTMMSSEQHIAPVAQSHLLRKFDNILLNSAFRAVSNTVHWYDSENSINIQRERSNVFEPQDSNLNYDNDFNEVIQDLQEITEDTGSSTGQARRGRWPASAEWMESVVQDLEPRFELELMEAPAPPPTTLPDILSDQQENRRESNLHRNRELEALINATRRFSEQPVTRGPRRRSYNEDVEFLSTLVSAAWEEIQGEERRRPSMRAVRRALSTSDERLAINRRLRRSARIAEQNNRQRE